MVAAEASLPRSLEQYFDSTESPLNPRNLGFRPFVYGEFQLLLTLGTAELLTGFCQALSLTPCTDASGELRDWSAHHQIHLVGRWISALAAVGSLVWLYLLTRLVFTRQAASLSLYLGAVCVALIQHAHFFTADSLALFFATATLYYLCRTAMRPGNADLVLAGVTAGITIACRINLLPLAGIGIIACLHGLRSCCGLRSVLIRYGVFLLACFIAVRATLPSLFSGFIEFDQRWIDDLNTVVGMGPDGLYPPSVQWAHRSRWLFPLKDMVFWGMGLGIATVALWGWITVLATIYRRGIRGSGGDNRLTGSVLLPRMLLWLFVTGYFLWVGGWPNPTMRYFLPLYPPLLAFAGYQLAMMWQRKMVGTCRGAWRGLVLGIVTLSSLWCLAFISIYLRDNPRHSAAEWINRSVPPGSVIGFETWDDALRIAPESAITSLSFNHYAEDRPIKRSRLLHWLDQVDYIVLTSNRVHASIYRQPLRYPMANRYYSTLFSGELGFEPAADFLVIPSLGGVAFPDQEDGFAPGSFADVSMSTPRYQSMIRFPAADEAFSVYDHPRVLIFRKKPEFNLDTASHVFADLDLESGLQTLTPAAESRAPTALLFNDETAEQVRHSGTWSALFDRDDFLNRFPWLGAFAVYGFVSLLGLLAIPICYRIFAGLTDRGMLLGKTFAIFALGTTSWILASLKVAAFSAGSIALVCCSFLAVSIFCAWRSGPGLGAALARNTRLLVSSEILCLLVFLLALTLRWFNPDLWHPWFGGEKPMDFAILNAVLKSDYFPPHDPFLSGGYLNYYYFGFVWVSVPLKLIGIVPETGYQIALALVFALTTSSVFGIAQSLKIPGSSRIVAGLATVMAVMFVGNLENARLLLARLMTRLTSGEWLPVAVHEWFWNASRVVPGVEGEPGLITEFPVFTLIYGDLHAHYMNLPITLLCLAFCLSWWYKPPLKPRSPPKRRLGLASIALGGSAMGVLYMGNAWDFPTYFLLGAIALGAAIAGGGMEYRARLSIQALLGYGLAYWLTTFPYRAHFATAYNHLVTYHGSATPLSQLLVIHGVFLLPISLYFYLRRQTLFAGNRDSVSTRLTHLLVCRRLWPVLAAGSAGLIVISWIVLPALLIGAPLIALSALIIMNPHQSRRDRAWATLVSVGASIILMVEFLALGNDYGRVNTVFKFYYQVWVLWGICAGVAVAYLLGKQGNSGQYRLARMPVMLLLTCGLLYTAMAIPSRQHYQMDPERENSLDGSLFMRRSIHEENSARFSLIWDYQAIHWIQRNITGTPVIAEGLSSREYLWGNRIAVHTGLASVVGWRYHASQSRSVLPTEFIRNRVRNVNRFFNDTDISYASEFLKQYQVDLVYVGPLEQAYYSDEGLRKFDIMAASGKLRLIYQNPRAKLFAIPR